MPQYDIFSEALPNTVALSTDDKTYVGSFHKSMLWHFPIIPPYMLMPRLIETAGEAYPTNFKGLLPYFVRQLGKHIYQIQKGSDELVENLYGWLQEFAPNDEDIDEQIEQLALLSICALQCYMLGQTLSFLAIGKTDFILAKIERYRSLFLYLELANNSIDCREPICLLNAVTSTEWLKEHATSCFGTFILSFSVPKPMSLTVRRMYPWAHLKLPDREFESPSIDYVASILGYNQARIFLSQLCSLKNPLSSQCIRDSSDLIIFDQTLRLFCELLLITNLPMVQTVVLADSILCTIHKMKGFRRRLYFIQYV